MAKKTKKKKTPSSQVELQHTLRDIAHSMASLKKPDRLLRMITRHIDKEWGISHTSILVLNTTREQFHFVDSKGKNKLPVSLIRFDQDHPFAMWCKKRIQASSSQRYLSKRDLKPAKSKGKKSALETKVAKAMEDFKVELVVPGYYKRNLIGMLLLGHKKDNKAFTASEISFFQILVQDCSMALKTAEYQQSLIEKNAQLEKQLKQIEKLREKEHKTFYEILRSLAQEVYAKDAYTFGHVKQVERLGLMTAKEMGVDLRGRKKDILSAGLILHDVGKIGIPDNILNKPARLDPEEWEIMKTHVDKGARILEHLTDFSEVAEIVMCHHEKYDGTGYPRGIAGENIPLQSRIVSVVDAFHAIVSTRCYSKGRPIKEAFKELRRCSGTQFDGEVVEALIRAVQKEMKKYGVDTFGDDGLNPDSESVQQTLSTQFSLS